MHPIKPCLEYDLEQSKKVRTAILDDETAGEVYAALCNMRWYKPNPMEDAVIIEKLKGEDCAWSCSWRVAGGIVARLRNPWLEIHESYMDWYCQGNEGHVTDYVKALFEELGWTPMPWDDEELI